MLLPSLVCRLAIHLCIQSAAHVVAIHMPLIDIVTCLCFQCGHHSDSSLFGLPNLYIQSDAHVVAIGGSGVCLSASCYVCQFPCLHCRVFICLALNPNTNKQTHSMQNFVMWHRIPHHSWIRGRHSDSSQRLGRADKRFSLSSWPRDSLSEQQKLLLSNSGWQGLSKTQIRKESSRSA